MVLNPRARVSECLASPFFFTVAIFSGPCITTRSSHGNDTSPFPSPTTFLDMRANESTHQKPRTSWDCTASVPQALVTYTLPGVSLCHSGVLHSLVNWFCSLGSSGDLGPTGDCKTRTERSGTVREREQNCESGSWRDWGQLHLLWVKEKIYVQTRNTSCLLGHQN